MNRVDEIQQSVDGVRLITNQILLVLIYFLNHGNLSSEFLDCLK